MTKYVIRQTRSFYGCNVTRSLVMDICNTALRFDTRAEAAEWVAQAEDAPYYTEDNEVTRPDYKIMSVKSLPKYLVSQI